MAVTRVREITVQFEAIHAIPRLPQWHHESRVHGHDYEIVLVIADQDAATEDAYQQTLTRWADEQLRGQHLNSFIEHPTDEHLAVWIYEQWTDRMPGLAEVRVSQTRDMTATYRPAT